MKDNFDANATNDESRLRPLSEVPDYQIADGHPDVRGWAVLSADNRRLGSVHELIVDTDALCTRYLDVALELNASGSSDTRDVLVPIGNARLDEIGDNVILDGDLVSRLASLPAYVGGHITREFENRLLPVSGADAPASKDFYASRHFDDSGFIKGRRTEQRNADETRVTRSEEELAFQKHQIEAGEVDIDRTVKSEHVTQRVPISRDEVTIDRHAIPGDRASEAEFREEHVRVPLKTEEVTVEKRPVVKEEVIVKKHAVADEKTVEADIRKEQLDIHRRTSPPTKDTHRDSDAR